MIPDEPVPGICPSCDLEGSVGDPCQERVCQKRGYAFIPAEHADEGERDPTIGRLIGDCLLVSLLGEGGFGKVFLALQKPLMMKVALKRLRIEGDASLAAVMLKKFEGEARALAQLGHPNIVRLIKYGTHEDAPYLVMEFIEGGRTLLDDMSQSSPPRFAEHILKQILDGLEAAHRRDLIHRDIKPENIMLQSVAGNEALVRILDFGLAKSVAGRTATSMAIGTPIYMAPEQLDMRHLGPWTDLYALGVIVFQMFCGHSPFPGDTHIEIIARKLDPLFDPIEAVKDSGLTEAQQSFLKKALARDIEARYQDVSQFRAGLTEALNSAPPSKPEDPEPETMALTPTVNLAHDTTEIQDPEPPRQNPRTPTVVERGPTLKNPRTPTAVEPADLQPASTPKPPPHRPDPQSARLWPRRSDPHPYRRGGLCHQRARRSRKERDHQAHRARSHPRSQPHLHTRSQTRAHP